MFAGCLVNHDRTHSLYKRKKILCCDFWKSVFSPLLSNDHNEVLVNRYTTGLVWLKMSIDKRLNVSCDIHPEGISNFCGLFLYYSQYLFNVYTGGTVEMSIWFDQNYWLDWMSHNNEELTNHYTTCLVGINIPIDKRLKVSCDIHPQGIFNFCFSNRNTTILQNGGVPNGVCVCLSVRKTTTGWGQSFLTPDYPSWVIDFYWNLLS